jgi:hypothetical protein
MCLVLDLILRDVDMGRVVGLSDVGGIDGNTLQSELKELGKSV